MSQWKSELKHTIKNYLELFKLINLDINLIKPDIVDQLKANKFPLLITQSFVKRIKHSDPKDPLLLQILPNGLSKSKHSNYLIDPLQETRFNTLPGLIHKYYGRVLMIATSNCAIHCQYCFRQHFNYEHNLAIGKNLTNIINYISQNPSINEIILSGGDPLLANNNYFEKLFKLLSDLSHITTVRIHSRIPIVLPSRLEPSLIKILTNNRFNIVLVIHANHPNEINQEVAKYIKQLHKTKIVLLNQSVLLKDINNNALILSELSKKLFDLKILPYYLHTLDPVQGAENFSISMTETIKIFNQLIQILPGYLVPKLVTEKPGYKSKVLINLGQA